MNAPLVDRFGRVHTDLRISVTDRCNLRCTYCMPEEVTFQPREELLTFEEIARFVRIVARMGVNKLRLTGGEPLLRRDLSVLAAMLVNTPGIHDVAITTNGVLLADQAQDLFEAGIRRLNISLDALEAKTFQVIARRDALDQVIAGIDAARSAGFHPIKINAVAMAGVSESQIVRLARFCRDRGLELRFIEYMPLEADAVWERRDVLDAKTILSMLADAGLPTVPAHRDDPSAPAVDYDYLDGKGRIGVIASVSEPFCGSCNRIRITADGKLRNCLFALDEIDIKSRLRSGANDDEIAELVRGSVADKWAGHQINMAGFIRPERTMHTIGG